MSGVHLTFSGNCRDAMTFYQDCLGGELCFMEFEGPLFTYPHLPVISATLVTDHLTLMASDLVHDEGRKSGNYMAILLECGDAEERIDLVQKLTKGVSDHAYEELRDLALIEFIDAFEVRWMLGVK